MRTFAWALGLGMLAVVALAGGCPKDKANPGPATGSGGTASGSASGSAKGAGGKGFALVVTPPKDIKAGEEATATVSLTPRGEYKVNLEYPLRLTVEGPTGATPQKVVLAAKDAKQMTEQGVLLLPRAKLGQAGDHTFKAELRFSVCTKKHCELLREQLTWVSKVR